MKEKVHVIERLAKGAKCKDCVSFRECARDATLPAFETGQAALCKGFAQRKPQTNADRMIAMIQSGQVRDLLDWWEEIFEDGVPGDDYFEWWLKQPVKDGDNDGE